MALPLPRAPKGSFVFVMVFLFIGMSGTVMSTGPGRQGRQLEWSRVVEAYDAFIDLPSPQNADRLLSALPADRIVEEIGDGVSALDHMFQEVDSLVLYEEVISGERYALEIYIRLLRYVDGYYREFIESTLGWLARDKPDLLLDMFLKYKDFEPFKDHGFPVSFIGMGHNVHLKAADFILGKRLLALSSVKDPKYAEIQAQCINDIKKALKRQRTID